MLRFKPTFSLSTFTFIKRLLLFKAAKFRYQIFTLGFLFSPTPILLPSLFLDLLLGRSPEEGKGYPLQDSDLEMSMGSQGSDKTERLSLSQCSLFSEYSNILLNFRYFVFHSTLYIKSHLMA